MKGVFLGDTGGCEDVTSGIGSGVRIGMVLGQWSGLAAVFLIKILYVLVISLYQSVRFFLCALLDNWQKFSNQSEE